MRAMVLAAGLGTRMLPLTGLRPKCLMPVMNRPLLGLWLARLAKMGIARAVVNTHHLAGMVQDYLAGPRPSGLEVLESHEPVILGTGGGLVKARPLLGENPFFLVSADVLATAQLQVLEEARRSSGAVAVLGLLDDPRFNIVATDGQGGIHGFKGRPGLAGDKMQPPGLRWLTYSNLAAISPELWDFLPRSGPANLADAFQAVISAGRLLLGVEIQGFWDNLGTPEQLLGLHGKLIHSPPSSLSCLAPAAPLVLAPGAEFAPGARTEGFAVLGEGAVVESGAWVKDSILLPGARVAAGARVRNAILGDGFLARGEIVGGAHA